MDNFAKLLNSSLRFLSYRPRSEKEVREYLNKKSSIAKIPEEQKINLKSVIDLVITKLKEKEFLNDKEFIKWWIEQRTKVKPKSLQFIKYELKQKGISNDLIEEVLENADFEIESDLDKAKKLAEKRIVRYENEDPKKRYEKMVRFLASKGFDWNTIKKVIDQILNKRYNND